MSAIIWTGAYPCTPQRWQQRARVRVVAGKAPALANRVWQPPCSPHDDVQYVADDMALLTGPSLDVVPVAMPLVLKSGSWQALDPFLPDLAEKATYSRLGKVSRYWAPPRKRIAKKPQAVRAIVFPRYAEAAGIDIVPISPLEVIGRLTAAPCALRPPITAAALKEIATFAHRVPGYAITYSALDAACLAVLDLPNK